MIEYQRTLKEHIYKCVMMKRQYGELVNVIKNYYHRDLNPKDKRSVSALVGMLSNEIYKNVLAQEIEEEIKVPI